MLIVNSNVFVISNDKCDKFCSIIIIMSVL